MRHLFISFGIAACIGGASAGEAHPPDAKAITQIESGPLYLGSINSGFKVSEDYFDANLNIVAPVWSSMGSDGFLGGGIVFLEPYVSWGENGEVATSLGLGYRYLFNDQPVSELRSPRDDQAGFWDEGVAIGTSLFVDLLDTEADNRFWQLGFGVELATRYIELRGNYYLPLSDKQLAERRTFTEKQTSTRTTTRPVTQTSAPYDNGQGFLVQDQTTSLVASTTTTTTLIRHIFERYEEGMEGWDAEIAFLIPGLDKWCDVKLIGGYFELDNAPFGPQKGGTGNVEGWKAGIEVRPVPAIALTGMWYEDERFLGSDWVVGARMEIPFEAGDLGDGKGMWGRIRDAFKPRRRHLIERMAEPVHRQNSAIHVANTNKQKSKVAKQSKSTDTQVISQTKTKIVLGLGPSATNFTPAADGTLTLGGLTFNGATVQWQSTALVGTIYTNGIGSSIFVPAGGGSAMYLPAGSISPGGIGSAITFSASNIYSSTTTLAGGSLQISGANRSANFVLGASAVLDLAVNQGAAVLGTTSAFTNFNNIVAAFQGSISTGGLAALTKLGAGTLVLTGSNVSSGTTTLNAGTLVVDRATTLGLGSTLVLNNGGSTVNVNNTTTSGGSVVLSNNIITNINSGGTLAVAGFITMNNSSFSISNNNVTVAGTREITLSNLGSLSTGLIKAGTGTLVLNGTNAYSGTTTVNAGTLQLGSWSALGSQQDLVIGGVTGTARMILPQNVILSSPNTMTLQQSVKINGTSVNSGIYNVTNGAIFINGSSLPLSGAIITAP